MNDKIKAAEEIGKFARMFGAMIAAAEQFQAVGSLEQAANEARAAVNAERTALEKAHYDTAEARKQLQAALDEMAAAKATAKEIIDSAKAMALRIGDAADAEAWRLKDDAKAAVAAAQAKAEQIVAAADRTRAAANEDAYKVSQSVGELDAQLEAKRRELDAVNERIAQARAAAAAIIGG